ncbi:MAG: SIS domain-containing protein [Anaerolineales bacterium]|nr:SIS domain-containing protein [Anaerolineales bacterium]
MGTNIYLNALLPVLNRAFEIQKDVLALCVEKMADTIQNDHLIYVFGAGHAGIISEEMCYRAGGLVPMVPIFAPGLSVNTRPATLETDLERISGYAALILKAVKITKDDLLIIHSNSGRNTVAIEMAEEAKTRGVFVIALTSVAHSSAVSSRHPKGYKLMDVADLVIDNCGVPGDAICEIPGVDAPVASTSTVVGAALMNSLVAETAALLHARGVVPPIFRSANIDHSAESNQYWMDHYGSRLLYL